MHTRIFGVISGCQLTFGFGQVEWTTVYLCIAGYQIDDKGYHCRDMAFEKEPAVGLAFYDFRKLHGMVIISMNVGGMRLKLVKISLELWTKINFINW